MSATVDAFVLTRQWHARADGLRFVLWCASASGPVRLVFEGQEAVLFVDRGSMTRAGRRRAVELTTLEGQPVDAVYFTDLDALRAEAARLGWARAFEADVRPVERFLMERFVTGSLRAVGSVRRRAGHAELVGPAISSSAYVPALSMLALDIETEGLGGPLLSIATAGAGGERVLLHGTGPHIDGVTYCPDERALIAAFVAHVRCCDPDVLVGWNVVDFDLAYLVERGRALGLELALGRDGGRAVVLPGQREGQPTIARVPGRVVLDGIATLRAATYAFESFRLGDVAQALLGRGKEIAGTEDAVAEIVRMYEHDKPALAAYNLEDCRLVLDIFAHADLLGFLVQRQVLTGLPLDRQGGSVAAFDNLYLPRLHRFGHVAQDVGAASEAAQSPGGHVMESVPGLYRNVLVFDFKSLYPSIIRTFAIDPMGMAFPGDDPIAGFEGARFHRERHILPGLIETLWQARDEAKQRGDAARSRAIKILMNSFYGVLGAPGCRFSRSALASSITLRGHQILTDSGDFLQRRGLTVIYGDTDSLFVAADESQGEDACRALGRAVAGELNDYWRERLAREHRIASALELQFETHYLRFFMPTIRHSERGSKKRYAGTVRRRGALTVVIRGLEAVRTDWTPLARRFQRELFRRVFADEPYQAWMQAIADDLLAGKLDDELAYRKRLRRPPGDYGAGAPPHVRAARMLDRPVREIRYVMTTRGPQPVSQVTSPIDHQHYLDRQLAPAADGILHCLGTSFAAIAGAQQSLF